MFFCRKTPIDGRGRRKYAILYADTLKGKGGISFWLAVIRQIVFNIPMLFLLDRLFGMTGIVWTQASADLLTVIVTYIIYWRVYYCHIRRLEYRGQEAVL